MRQANAESAHGNDREFFGTFHCEISLPWPISPVVDPFVLLQ